MTCQRSCISSDVGAYFFNMNSLFLYACYHFVFSVSFHTSKVDYIKTFFYLTTIYIGVAITLDEQNELNTLMRIMFIFYNFNVVFIHNVKVNRSSYAIIGREIYKNQNMFPKWKPIFSWHPRQLCWAKYWK